MIYLGMMKKIMLAVSAFYFLACLSAFAKPMPAPTKDEALRSPVIAVVEYLSYRSIGEIDYFKGPVAEYKVIRILKGADVPGILNVRYDFDDGSACLPETGWEFGEDMMPEKGSKWILFLDKDAVADNWATYRGSFGRWYADPANIQEIENSLKEMK